MTRQRTSAAVESAAAPGATSPLPAGRVAPQRALLRAGAALAVAGGLMLLAGTGLHPAQADPNEATSAFAEYAATSRVLWVTSHLTQLAGITAVTLAMLLLARAVSDAGVGWSRATTVCGASTVAVTGVLQAVDGVALKAMVDLWSASAAEAKPELFAASVAVRQVEIGLAGVATILLAATTVGFSVLLVTSRLGTRAMGWLGLAAASLTAVGGLFICLEGFSARAMNLSMSGGVLGLIVLATVAAWSWRRAAR